MTIVISIATRLRPDFEDVRVSRIYGVIPQLRREEPLHDQWHKKRVLKFDDKGNVLREIDVGADICGHTFANGSLYVLRGQEQPNEDWRIARVNPQKETPAVEDIAVVPFACRSLTFDGESFWSNYRAKGTIISFSLPS